jgi:hypothetical protein
VNERNVEALAVAAMDRLRTKSAYAGDADYFADLNVIAAALRRGGYALHVLMQRHKGMSQEVADLAQLGHFT